jgi:hypothetical protein
MPKFLLTPVDLVSDNGLERVQTNKRPIQLFIHLIETFQKEQMETQIPMLLLLHLKW